MNAPTPPSAGADTTLSAIPTGAKIFEQILQLPAVHFKELEPVFGKMEQGALTPAFFDYQEDIYLASPTPLDIDGLIESNEAVFAAMNEARKIAEKKGKQQSISRKP